MTRIGVLALALAAAALHAGGPDGWVPARWQGGPLETLRRPAIPATTAAALRDWLDPRTLDLLEGTPINCLLVTWGIGRESKVESEQHRLVARYAASAHARGIAILGVVYAGADPERSAEAASRAGLDGLVVDGDFAAAPQIAARMRNILGARKTSVVMIPLCVGDSAAAGATWQVLGTGSTIAPRIQIFSESGSVSATPTTEPWIDSNTWFVRCMRVWSDRRPIWLGHLLENPAPPDYARAIADAAVAGGRWVLAPDDALMTGLARGDSEAMQAWHRINDTLAFYEPHADWRDFEPVAALGIVVDRGGGSSEAVHLIARRRIPYRLIARADLTARAVEGLRAVLATDLAPPAARERAVLAAFVENGGVLVVGKGYGAARDSGGGRIVVHEQDPPDAEALARDLWDLIGVENFPVRLFHVPSVLAHATAPRDRTRLLVHLVNYASMPADAITVRAAGDYRGARLFRPGAPPEPVRVARRGNYTDARIDKVAVSAALLFEN